MCGSSDTIVPDVWYSLNLPTFTTDKDEAERFADAVSTLTGFAVSVVPSEPEDTE